MLEMTSLLKRNLHLLKTIRTGTPKLRKAVLKNCSNDLIKCLAECSHNVLEGNVPLPAKHRRPLLRYKKNVRLLGSRSTSLGRKRQILTSQSGGALATAVIVPILGLALSLLADRLKS